MADADQIRALTSEFYRRSSSHLPDDSTGSLVPTPKPTSPFPYTDDYSYIGTDELEFYVAGLDALSVRSEQVDQLRLRFYTLPGDCQVFIEGPFAWVVDQPILVREGRPRVRLRFSAILRFENAQWKFAHVHVSAGVRNEELWGHRVTTSLDDLADRAADHALSRSTEPMGEALTIVFTDITSSTEYMVRIGDDDWLELVRWHNWKVREAVVAHGGHEVKSQGDGFMLAFDKVEGAFDCMLALLSVFAVPERRWDPKYLGVRLGAHTGPAARDLGDYYGSSVVTAARIAASAEGGQALVSDISAKASVGYEFGKPQRLSLKGLPGIHTVFPLIGRT